MSRIIRPRVLGPQPEPEPAPQGSTTWTPEEDDELLELWLTLPQPRGRVRAIAARMGRTEDAVKTRLWKVAERYRPGAADYAPGPARSDRRGAHWGYHDKAVLAQACNPEGRAHLAHSTAHLAAVLMRSPREVNEELDLLAEEGARRLGVPAAWDSEIRRAELVEAELGGKYPMEDAGGK